MLISAFSTVRQFVASEDGPTALEYAVLIAMIILACLLAITGFGTAVSNWFSGATPTVSSLATSP